MKSQFNVNRGSCSTTRQSYDGVSSLAPNLPGHTWQLVNDVKELLGEESEPDPLFLVESWTLGVPAAVVNWQRRRQGQADRGVCTAAIASEPRVSCTMVRCIRSSSLRLAPLRMLYAATPVGGSLLEILPSGRKTVHHKNGIHTLMSAKAATTQFIQ